MSSSLPHKPPISYLCAAVTILRHRMISMSSLLAHAQETPFASLFEHCHSPDQLKKIHSQFIKMGLTSNSIVQNKLITFCCCQEWGDMIYARQMFDTISQPNVFFWNTLIKGYSRISRPKDGVFMYLEMLKSDIKPDHYTFPFLLKGFNGDIALECGRELHGHILEVGLGYDVFVQKALIHMYILCQRIDMARHVFNRRSQEDVVMWNVMLSAYNRLKQYKESRQLFEEMKRNGVIPTVVTLVSVLSACSGLKDIASGEGAYQYVKDCGIELNISAENALIDMYATNGEMGIAVGIFGGMKSRDVISWTAIVSGFVNAGQVDLARKYFEQMPERDSVSWTAMIDGYLRLNRFNAALILFREMQSSNIKPDEFTVVSILTACARLGALEVGEWIMTFIDKSNVNTDIFVGNALIDMYFKCGNVEKARNVFNDMLWRDKFTWTAMIVGLAMNGQGEEALDTFSRMLQASVTPDGITYIGALCACSHTGKVEKGGQIFASMISQQGIKPNVTHYGCMVDLLGRAGHLNDAHEVIKNMPMRPNPTVWGSLLAACRVHKNPEMAEIAAKHILELEPDNGAVYVQLCNVYAACNKSESLCELRKLMMERRMKKIPGCSLIEMNGIVHEFVAGDHSHPLSKQIYTKLEEMDRDLKFEGYSPDTSEVFLDVGEEDKESAVNKERDWQWRTGW